MIAVPDLTVVVEGAAVLEPGEHGLLPHRLPSWVRSQMPDPQLLTAERQPSGVRLRFRTDATRVELVLHPSRTTFAGVDRPRGHVDVTVDGEHVLRDELTGGDLTVVDLATGSPTIVRGEHHRTDVQLPSGTTTVELWLPHQESVELVALRADGVVDSAPGKGPRWIHHGSSISQGSNAAGPRDVWPIAAAEALGLDLRNLGLGGSALVDPALARVIRDASADVISLAFGINVVNLDGMRRRTLLAAVHGFLDTVRDGHPTAPILLITPLHCEIHERTPGPGGIDPAALATGRLRFLATGTTGDTALGRLTLEAVREVLADVVAHRADDPHLHLLDGLELYGAADERAAPLPDGLHPDTATHHLIAWRFVEHARSRHAPFAPVVGHTTGGSR
ncbi:GDSL-type esterase/lipase family protein [Serinibacter arcticus]|uniref:Uncharacterized protein n=1 Tax=Serinibacter arcticus TaxID=1655435 RepID=A0A4Z1E4D5_9MICO|nr:GDSL-type esterase/lipase family protein [Serinibacter arcticus]TGO04607.1 hypothetical protein SERN_2200 [Serinibacter arcticus]